MNTRPAASAVAAMQPASPRSLARPQSTPATSAALLTFCNRWFFSGAAILMLVAVLVGFGQFYFHGRAFPNREITPPIRSLVIAHGVVMAAWILLAIVQPVLVASGRRKLHMMTGRFGALIAAAILVFGLMLGIQSARVAPPQFELMGFNSVQFMAIPVISVLFFASLFSLAIYYRKRPAAHRAFMLTASLATISAALSRIDALNNLYVGTLWDRLFGPFFAAVVLGVILFALRTLLTRTVDRWLAGNIAALVLVSAFIVWFARTPVWHAISSAIIGGPHA